MTESLITGGHVRSADDTRIDYLSVGSGPTLVCLHGGLATGVDWMPTAKILADHYRVVIYDRRGAGASDHGVSGHTVDLEVEDLRAVLEMTGPARAVLAHSFGAMIVMNAATRPWFTDVDALVLYEPPVMINRQQAVEHLAKARELMAGGAHEALLLEALENMLELSPTLIEAMRSDLRAWSALVAAAPTLLAQAEMSIEVAERYEHFRAVMVPVLLLLGEHGGSFEIFQESAKVLRETIPSLTEATLKGQGHAAMLRAPDLLAAQIVGYLDGGPAGRYYR